MDFTVKTLVMIFLATYLCQEAMISHPHMFAVVFEEPTSYCFYRSGEMKPYKGTDEGCQK